MNKYIQILVFLFLMTGLAAQNTQYTKAGDSDPEAKALLEKVKNKYDNYKTVTADFSLEMVFPAEKGTNKTIVQKGKLSRKGELYKVEMDDQGIICDGEALYIILHRNKEVQINEIPDEDEDALLSPQAIFSFYESGQFAYQMVNDPNIKGNQMLIEFKPLEEDAEYTKLRVLLDKTNNQFLHAKAFSRDGSKYTFQIEKLTPNPSFATNFFAFDANQYKDYYVEDLR